MNTAKQTNFPVTGPRSWFSRGEAWLDERGIAAWIAVMVLAFIAAWPVGLAILAYMIWSKRMFSKSCAHHRSAQSTVWRDQKYARRHGFASSGNTAFDAYKAETLRRLTDEQEAFEAFLDRLRAAKDKSEFDKFMDERAEVAQEARDDAYEDLEGDFTEAGMDEMEALDEPDGKKNKKKS